MSPVEMLFSLSVLGQGSGFKSGGCFWVQGEWCTLDSICFLVGFCTGTFNPQVSGCLGFRSSGSKGAVCCDCGLGPDGPVVSVKVQSNCLFLHS